MKVLCIILSVVIAISLTYSFITKRIHSRYLVRYVDKIRSTTGPDDKNNVIKQNENAVVDKGLTHIKYNKYAPTAEEAKNMTDVEFRATIYNRMKAAELERKALNANRVGGAVSDDYIASLSRKKSQ